MIDDDLERLRLTDADFGRELASQLESAFGEVPDVVALVSTDGSFPASAARFFKVIPQTVMGTESEGQTGSYTAMSNAFYALNIGGNLPTNGTTKVICSYVPHRWVFEV